MRSSKEYGSDGIKRIIKENAELQQLLRDVLEEYSRNDFRRVEKMLIDGFKRHNLVVIKMKSANNTNYKAYQNQHKYDDDQEIPIAIEDSSSDEEQRDPYDEEIVIAIEESSSESEDESANIPAERKIIIQLCRKSPESISADDMLANAKYPWQADSLFFDSLEAKDIPSDRVCLTVMDYYPNTLDKMVERLRDENDPDACIEAAQKVGRQISSILESLTMHKLIWTDMKPGNLLMRGNEQVVIADTKGIVDPARLTRRKKGNQSLIFGDVSSGFLSDDFKKKRQMSTRDPAEAIAVWEREYSHNLAITLYSLATATKVEDVIPAGDEGINFNFNHRVFESPRGQRLQYIIAKLGDPNLFDRMHHKDADKLLSLLDDDEFELEKSRVETGILEAKN